LQFPWIIHGHLHDASQLISGAKRYRQGKDSFNFALKTNCSRFEKKKAGNQEIREVLRGSYLAK